MEENKNYDIGLLEEKATEGDVSAVQQLIEIYEKGIGVEKNSIIAERWRKWAAENGMLIELNTAVEDEVDANENLSAVSEDSDASKAADEMDWDSYRRSYEIKPFNKLKELDEAGDPIATLVMGEKYLHSAVKAERSSGIGLINKSINSIQNKTSSEGMTELDRRALIEAWADRGNYYWGKVFSPDQPLNNDHSDDGNEAFKAFSHVAELDQGNVDGLIKCYEKGVGCNINKEAVNQLKKARAERGGFKEKYDYAISLDAGSVIAVEMFQEALSSDDADEHPYLKSKARLFIAEQNEPDENGIPIDIDTEKNIIAGIQAEGKDKDYIEEKEIEERRIKEQRLAEEREAQRREAEAQREADRQRQIEFEQRRMAEAYHEKTARKRQKYAVAAILLIALLILAAAGSLKNSISDYITIKNTEEKVEAKIDSEMKSDKAAAYRKEAKSDIKDVKYKDAETFSKEKKDVIKNFHKASYIQFQDNGVLGDCTLKGEKFYLVKSEYDDKNGDKLIGIYHLYNTMFEEDRYYVTLFSPIDSNTKASSLDEESVVYYTDYYDSESGGYEKVIDDFMSKHGEGTKYEITNVANII